MPGQRPHSPANPRRHAIGRALHTRAYRWPTPADDRVRDGMREGQRDEVSHADDARPNLEALNETIDALGATVAVALAACGPQASLEVVRLLGDIGRTYPAHSLTGIALRLVCRRVVAQLGLAEHGDSDGMPGTLGPESVTPH